MAETFNFLNLGKKEEEEEEENELLKFPKIFDFGNLKYLAIYNVYCKMHDFSTVPELNRTVRHSTLFVTATFPGQD